MAITIDDFSKIWASASPLTPYEFSEDNYKNGWNFVGATPPSRQMWDYLQKKNDEKAQWLYLNIVQGVPIGVVQAFAGNTVPDGWLLCDGSAASRTDYAELYSVIGDTYGAGDGESTFNLPNLIDKFVQGNATAGTVKTAGLPNISGNLQVLGQQTNNGTAFGLALKGDGVFNDGKAINVGDGVATIQITSQNATQNFVDGNPKYPIRFNASKANSIYGNSTTVQPPALTMRYIIKY